MYKFIRTKQSDSTVYITDQKVVDKLTPDIIIDEFQLNSWEARMAPNHKENGNLVGKSNYVYRHNLAEGLPGQDKLLDPFVRDSHKIIQFREGAKWFEYFTREGLLTLDSALIMNESHFGITCDLGLEGVVQGEDVVNRYFILSLGHVKGTPKMLGFTDIRPVCCNTLVSAAAGALGKAGMAFNLESDPESAMQKARGMINLVERRFHEIELPAYKAYANIKVTTDERELLFRKLLGMPLEGWDVSDTLTNSYQRLEEAYKSSPGMEMFDTKEHTGWRVLQAVTWGAKTLGKTDWDKYKSRYSHSWVNKTHDWLSLRFDKKMAPVGSKLINGPARDLVPA